MHPPGRARRQPGAAVGADGINGVCIVMQGPRATSSASTVWGAGQLTALNLSVPAGGGLARWQLADQETDIGCAPTSCGQRSRRCKRLQEPPLGAQSPVARPVGLIPAVHRPASGFPSRLDVTRGPITSAARTGADERFRQPQGRPEVRQGVVANGYTA